MELHAQSDCLITHGGYMRALNEGRLGNILQIRDKDLAEWRCNNGLNCIPPWSLPAPAWSFPKHDSLHDHDQAVYIATGRNADPDRIRYWQDLGYTILIAGEQSMVHGAPLIHQLSGLGLQERFI